MKYKIGEKTFKTKKEAENFTRNYIKNLGYGDFDVYNNYEAFMFFIDLINNHHNFKDKIGCGIKSIRIQRNILNKNAFETIILRKDNSEIDFSWLKCSTSSSNSIIDNLKAAMRQSILPEIQNFKNKSIMKCVFCNSVEGEFHADHHEPSFIQLFNDFIKLYSNYPKIFDDDPKTHIAIFRKEDEKFSDIWKKYHNKNMNLQILCSTCNLRKNRK
jgi:hypothetical protein